MKAHHSGLTGRTDRQKRYAENNIAKGLCRFCSNPLIEGKKHCQYHINYQKKYYEEKRKRE